MPENDFVSGMTPLERAIAEEHLKCINPDDAKYWKTTAKISPYLSADAEWRACALVQLLLLETRMEFGQAEQRHVDEVRAALPKISPLNMSLIEDAVTKHDQLAVLEELGRFISPETKALLHPGTTSYDILDTARSYLFKEAWKKVIRPKAKSAVTALCDLAEQHLDLLQVGRTHLQDTSPVTFGMLLAGDARRLADEMMAADERFNDLRGKVRGIVGTGASIEVVIGKGKVLDFEKRMLDKLGLKPDSASSQIVQKERVYRAACCISSMAGILANFSNAMRILYSSAIGEVTSRDAKQRLGGSSADAGKNNPVNFENIAGKWTVVEAGLTIVARQSDTDLQRDLRNSVQARYEPQLMMTRFYESTCRLARSLETLSVNEGRMAENLVPVRVRPTEAMTAVARAHGYVHPTLGVGHDAVKAFAKQAQTSGRKLLGVALRYRHFKAAYESWPDWHKAILGGKLEQYLGAAKEIARENIDHARRV